MFNDYYNRYRPYDRWYWYHRPYPYYDYYYNYHDYPYDHWRYSQYSGINQSINNFGSMQDVWQSALINQYRRY